MSTTPPRPDLTETIRLIRAKWADASAIWLFGSNITGQFHADSDIDLAVLAPRPFDQLARFDLQLALGALLDRDVDLVDLASANTVLRCEVTSRGELIWSADKDVALSFSGRVLGEYARWREMTAPLRASIANDGRIVSQ